MKLKIWLICIISTLGGFLFGYDTAVISGTLSFVREQFELNSLTEGWFVGSALLGCILGVSFAGVIADRGGRKMTLLLSSLLMGISALGCAISPGLEILILYRLIGGVGVGIASMLSPLYISEVSPADHRGKLVSLYQFAITVGILTAYFSNAKILAINMNIQADALPLVRSLFADEIWRMMFGSELIPALIFLVFLLTIPESPRWLITRGKEGRAKTIMQKIAGTVNAERQIAEIRETLSCKKGGWKDLFYPGIRRAVFIGAALALLSQFTGINAVIYYGPRIFESAGLSTDRSLGGQVIIGIVNVVFTLLAIWKIDSLGRRVLLITGCTGMMIAHIAIGSLFKWGSTDGPLLLVLMMLFIAFFAFSYGPVIWTLLSEIYPTQIRGRAMSIATLTLWAGTYIIGQLVPWLFDKFETHGTFWLFALMCIPAILITWLMVPETKGKSLEQIEKHWYGESQNPIKFKKS